MALKQFGMDIGEGLCTDMRAVRKDYFLDHDHSAYVDQWDWELAINEKQRNLALLREVVEKIWKVLTGAEKHIQERFPQLKTDQYPSLPEKLTFIHAEDILARYPDLPRKQRGNSDPAGVSGDLYLRDRMGARGRLSARTPGRGLRRLVYRVPVQ